MRPDPIKIPLSGESEEKMKKFLRTRIRSIRNGLKDWHETQIPEYRRRYDAKPLEPTREFPFQNASNLVVPIVAIHTDTLLARVMSAVFKTRPLWTTRIIGMLLAKDDPNSPDDFKNIIEEHLQYAALEPSILDLYRVYHEWFGEAIKIGTSVLKCPQYEQIEDVVVPAGDSSAKFSYERKTIYSGPKPEKLPIEDFGLPINSKTIEGADFKYHRKRLQKWELEERSFQKIYDKKAVDAIIAAGPDNSSRDTVQKQKEEDANLHRTSEDEVWAEWHIYECYYRYRIDSDHTVRCLATYHERTDTLLRAFFDYYPENIFIGARMFYRDDLWPGYGFGETMAQFQEEDSEIHNGWRDAQTVANAKVWRVNPDSPLHQGYKIFPSAMLPAEEGEIEAMAHGDPSDMNIEAEKLVLELADRRSGIQASQQGAGSGTMGKKGYSAMGTLAVMQDGNSRQDLNITDIRYAHTKVARLLGIHYSTFGISEEQSVAFADKRPLLERAYDMMKQNKIVIPIYGATASTNREVEKQNDLMLSNIMARHYQMITQMIQGATNVMAPSPAVKLYLTSAMKSANLLMMTVMRHFGYDEVEQFVPKVDPKMLEAQPQPQPQPGGPQVPGVGAPGAGPASPGGPPGPPPASGAPPVIPGMPAGDASRGPGGGNGGGQIQ